jgi:hypothetical protein
LQVAKELWTSFAHRFGKPSQKLIRIIESSRFEEFPIRLMEEGYEVTLVLSRMIAEVIQVTAYMITKRLKPAAYPCSNGLMLNKVTPHFGSIGIAALAKGVPGS